MKDIRELFKSKKYILLFSMALTTISILFFKIIGAGGNYEGLILPTLSLLGGPYALLGFIIIEGIYLMISSPNNIQLILITLFIAYIGNILLWKLWYSIMTKYGYEIPNLQSLYRIIKVFVIFMIHLAALFVMYEGFFKGQYGTSAAYAQLASIHSLSMIFMLFGIHVFIKYKIPPYTPKKQIKQYLPEKSYPIIFIAAIIIGLANIFITNDLIHSIITVLIIALIIIYAAKPLPENCKIKDDVTFNLFNKINSSLFLLLILMLFLTAFSIYMVIPQDITPARLIDEFASITAQFFTLILIPILIYMYYIEKKMIKPIHKLSESLSGKIDTYEDFENLKSNLNSIKVNNELDSLTDSLLKMETDLRVYGAQLIEVTSQKERFDTELELAHEMQNSMIPKNFEEYTSDNDCEMWGLMEPAREVGGDFYDYFKIDDDNLGFVIGDVSGKGVSAALIMVKSMTLIQDYALHYEDLAEVFYEVNNLLCEGNVEELFVTCWFGKINLKTKKLTYVNAGHAPPLIKQNDDFEYMEMKPGLVLAAMEDIPYETSEIQLKSGDSIILYTDGITDANLNYKDFYGEERLKNIVNKHKNDDLEKIILSVKKDVNAFCENSEQFDDTTMFAIRLK